MIAVGEPSSPSRLLSARFDSALVFAAQLHATQARKGSGVPYIAHLLAVASLVLEHGGTEDDAIAALLHDAVEDQGGRATRDRIRALFGVAVTAIVDGCSDTDQTPKPPWKQRKEAYIAHLPDASASVRLVSLADKVHNAQTILHDYRRMDAALWSRFTAGRDDQLWYYRSLVQAFQGTDTADTAPQLVANLNEAVSALEHETAAETPSPPRTGRDCGASDVSSRSSRRTDEHVWDRG
jgi:(p)ppGpp synthase/HD superfamily hydrolase